MYQINEPIKEARLDTTTTTINTRDSTDSTKFNSFNSSFTRGLYKTLAQRSSPISSAHCVWNGMLNGKLSSIEQTANWPLLKLSQNIMLKNHLVPQNMINKPVVSPHFDCYMNNIIAPDHRITGLTKSLIDCCFDCLEAHPDKLKLESAVCIGLRSIGFHGDKNIYNYNSKSINSMSM